MKRFIVLLITAVVILSLTACGRTGQQTPSTTVTPTAPPQTGTGSGSKPYDVKANLRIIWWGSQTRHDYTLAAIDVFEKKYPNITLTAEFTAWDSYWEKLAAMSASKNLPDIIQQDYKYITSYTNNNLIIDLFPYVERGVIDLSNCPEATWSGGIVNDKLVAINLGMNTHCVMIDKDIFDKAGIPIPEDTWTIKEYQEICDKLVAMKDQLGIDYADQSSKNAFNEQIQFAFREKGLWFYNQDGSESFGWDKETGKQIIVELLKREKENIEKKRTAPLAVREENEVNGPESGLIVKGKVAMNSGNWSNQAKSISNAAGKKFVLVALPSETTKKMQYMKPSQFFSVSSNSKYPEQAAFFISEFINNIEMNYELKGERGVPISDKVREALAATFEPDSIDKAVFDYVGRIAPIANDIWKPEPNANAAIIVLYQNMLKNVVDEGMDPEQAFEIFYEQAMIEFEMAK
ncbi:putative ABC transporter substrate-binding protein YesO [Thermoclostridium stercorarium subsp. stercorarium DSM 8532]|jgi:multiple sugar transport system substrate-binding protein|uniref:ABC transporter substrate-binding protein n=3 Tax=Thermoclostridium stercorarium TaxID=1510 RepID=A0A1B1YHP9_THEST|nr:extracellular solute-binding protein [Thermoclostridium stercorarium]AGC67256.1 putative ABC transporter substrate-binding protein YesO [Thermoclostridium stercorarium subsp. stercorarium DSM 8532]AGI38325.1 ABC transporter periplasmic subunit [Thermoclostridium stercorarium subsp. stercorarium DSM 8532]ANW97762.1 ABC transporter substrate-binding protein [Thermoclostridium stercorarium subsp. thermolacticum DSM 2910]ANX00289.1 ABC transporter substrate-binding protein [Thermoclostridium ste